MNGKESLPRAEKKRRVPDRNELMEKRIKALALKMHRGEDIPPFEKLAHRWEVPNKRAAWMISKARQRARKIARENIEFRRVLTLEEREVIIDAIREEGLTRPQVIKRWNVSKPQAEYLVRRSS